MATYAKPVVGTISVRHGDIHVVPDGGYASDACLETDAMRSVIDVFKDRLRSIKLMNAMNARGELTLARARMRLPDSEEG